MKSYISDNIQQAICLIMKDFQGGRPIDSLHALSEPDKEIMRQAIL